MTNRPLLKRILTLLSATFIFLWSIECAGKDESIEKLTPKNLRVVWTESPQTEALIAWDSIGEAKGSLHVREAKGEKKTLAASCNAYVDIVVSSGRAYERLRRQAEKPGETRSLEELAKSLQPRKYPTDFTHCYRAQLEGLKPDTKYFLTAQLDSDEGTKKTKEYYFITAPAADKDFKLIYGADSRKGDRGEAQKMVKNLFEKDPSFIALVHGGDYTKDQTVHQFSGWLRSYSSTTTSDGRLLPIIPVRGNHENQEGEDLPFDMAYGYPGKRAGNTDAVFNCMLSPQVSLTVLYPTKTTDAWLAKTLADIDEKKVRWRLAAFHSPMYPAVKASKSKPPRGNGHPWVKLMEKYNIDVVLDADGHCVKRTVPIRNGKQAADGITYLGEGGYGIHSRKTQGWAWYLQKPGFHGQYVHLMILSFTKDKIDYHTKTLHDGIVDEMSFKARQR